MDSEIKKAVDALKAGGVIIYPTDTLYGLGADATNAEAVKKVYEVKGRSFRKPLSIAVANVRIAKKFAQWNKNADVLSKKFLPGPLTLVLKLKKKLPKNLNHGSKKIGIRIPDHPTALKILKKMKIPITATSANISGKPATNLKSIKKQLGKKVDLVIAGKCKYYKPSTVVDLTLKKPKILRIGVISKKKIELALQG